MHMPLTANPAATVRVGLIDTGVDSTHPELAGKITAHYETTLLPGEIRVDQVRVGTDHNAHGTACAHILHRAAPAALIHSVQVIGQYSQDIPDKLISGLRFAVEQGWEVINISAGLTKPNAEIHHLVQQAYAAGTILIAAKDNHPEIIGYPAAYPEVICVDMEYFPEQLAWRYFPNATTSIEVEASGIYIEAATPGGGTRSYTGTSFAAPTIAAIAAKFKARHPNQGTPEFRNFLKAGSIKKT